MFCLECGRKIEDGETACANCGLTVEEIKERVAAAQEKVTYAETVGPDSTTKLPPISERVYRDKDGNIINPEEAIETKVADKSKADDLPVVGNEEDPYITMPMPRVVSDDGQVMKGQSAEARAFMQEPQKKKGLSARSKAILTLVVIFAVIAIAAALANSAGLLDQSAIGDGESAETATTEEIVDETPNDEEIRLSNILKSLTTSYQTLGNYRGQVGAIVSNFNNYYMASDKAKRQQYADECNALIQSISDSKSDLIEEMNELGLSEDNTYFVTYEDINKLYELLVTRLTVIKECWDVSLASSDPKTDAEKILAPLSKDLRQGKSISINDFDALYPQVPFPELPH